MWGLQLTLAVVCAGIRLQSLFDVITSLVSIRRGACTEKSDVIVQP